MNIEIWKKENSQTNHMIGIAKVSLHQFFIAFNNAHIRNHVTKQKVCIVNSFNLEFFFVNIRFCF